MAQFNTGNNAFQASNKTLFEVSMDADENGQLIDRRYALDALGRRKSTQDYSVFSAEAVSFVPSRVWEMVHINNTGPSPVLTIQRLSNTYVTSETGMFTIKSGNTVNIGYVARTKEFIRTQPNRGQLFSWSAEFPNPNAVGSRVVGPASAENAIVLILQGTGTSWNLLYRRRNDGVDVTTVNLTSLLPADFDPSKGHLYDIQLQWRGVGNIRVFVDEQEIYVEKLLNTLEGVSLRDNALPFSMLSQCMLAGTEVVTKVGCVDISSEGGVYEPSIFGAISTGNTSVITRTTDTAVLALRVPRYFNYNGNTKFNTRGVIMDKLITWTRDEAVTSVKLFRDYDAPTLESITWSPVVDSKLTYAIGGYLSPLSNAAITNSANGFVLLEEWSDLETKNVITNDSKSARFQIAPGDILVISVKSLAQNKDNYTTLYYSEQL